MGHLLDQVGHRFHGADEVAGSQVTHVAGGHGQRRLEGRPPGPGGHGGGQARGRLPGAWDEMQLLDRPDPLGHVLEGGAAPFELGDPLLAQPVSQRALAPAAAGGRPGAGSAMAGETARPPRFEDHSRDHPGEDRRLGSVEDFGRQRLGQEEVRLVVDPGQSAPGLGEGPVLEIAQLFQDGDAVTQLNGEKVGLLGLPLGEGASEHVVGRLAVKTGGQVDREVVGGPKGRAQVGRGRQGDSGRLAERGFGGPQGYGVAFLVQPPTSGPPGQLQVLA